MMILALSLVFTACAPVYRDCNSTEGNGGCPADTDYDGVVWVRVCGDAWIATCEDGGDLSELGPLSWQTYEGPGAFTRASCVPHADGSGALDSVCDGFDTPTECVRVPCDGHQYGPGVN